MINDVLPRFVVGQVWQCRDQRYVGTITAVNQDGYDGWANIRCGGIPMYDHHYNYNRKARDVGFPACVDEMVHEDLMRVLYCPSWGRASPLASADNAVITPGYTMQG